MNYFKEPYIPPLREELHIQENTFLEKYVEVKEENIEIFEEINEGLVIEEKPEIKIVEEIKKDHIIEKDLEIKMAETIEEEIVKEFNKIESNDYQYQDPFILVVSDTLKFIDFIGVDKFDSIVSSYLVNSYNYMKTKEKEIQIDMLFH